MQATNVWSLHPSIEPFLWTIASAKITGSCSRGDVEILQSDEVVIRRF